MDCISMRISTTTLYKHATIKYNIDINHSILGSYQVSWVIFISFKPASWSNLEKNGVKPFLRIEKRGEIPIDLKRWTWEEIVHKIICGINSIIHNSFRCMVYPPLRTLRNWRIKCKTMERSWENNRADQWVHKFYLSFDFNYHPLDWNSYQWMKLTWHVKIYLCFNRTYNTTFEYFH